MTKNDVIVVNYTGHRGGGALDAYEMAKALVENGKRVVPIISSGIENLEMWKNVDFEQIIMIDTYEGYTSFVLNTMLFPIIVKPKIISAIGDLNVKAVYCPMKAFWTDMINRLFPDAKIIMTIHDPTPHSGTSIYNKLAMMAMSSSSYDAVVVHSKIFIDEVKNKSKRVYYIPLGRHNLYRLSSKKQKIIDYDVNKINFVFFGRIEEYKGLDILAKAWEILDNNYHDNISLAIVGNGDFSPYRNMYRKFSNVKIINRWIKDEEVESVFMGEHLVCVCPYKDGTQSGVILVALDYGLPVIASDTGGFSEQIIDKKTGYLINPNDIVSLVTAMERFIHDEKLIEIMRADIKKYVDGISWNKSAEKLTNIIGEIT